MNKELLLRRLDDLGYEVDNIRKRLEQMENDDDKKTNPVPTSAKFNRGYLEIIHKTDGYTDLIDLERTSFVRAMHVWRNEEQKVRVEADILFANGSVKRVFLTPAGWESFRVYLGDRIPMSTVEGYNDPVEQRPVPVNEEKVVLPKEKKRLANLKNKKIKNVLHLKPYTLGLLEANNIVFLRDVINNMKKIPKIKGIGRDRIHEIAVSWETEVGLPWK